VRSKFPGYYKLNDFDLLWAEATFVLDTSVLLSLYRYPSKAKEETIATLEKLKDRLWIPYHVALEFQRNRLNVIHKQNSEFEEVLKQIGEFESGIRSLERLKERHSLIDPTSFIKSIGEITSKFREELDQLKGAQAQVHEDDAIRVEIDNLLDGKVGEGPSRESVVAWQESGKRRFPSKIPPGYMDVEKDKEKEKEKDQPIYAYGGIEYHKIYGDLIIWNQIIEQCKSNNITKLIFVTDDNKEDWWEKVGGKTIGPRPELAEEVRRLAGVTHFHMYRPGSFLENANKYIGAQIAEETIDQVRDISSAANKSDLRRRAVLYDRPLVNAVNDWLKTKYGADGLISFGDTDRYLIQKDGSFFGVELCDIRYLGGDEALGLVFDKVNTAISLLATSVWQSAYVFIVSENAEELLEVRSKIEGFLRKLITPITVNFAIFDGQSGGDLVVPFTATNVQSGNDGGN
jgi:hypothetical protein